MKLTWFGNRTFRIHLGGQIVVVDADAAPENIDRRELVGGADRAGALEGAWPLADAQTWRPRARERLLDAGEKMRPVDFWSVGANSILLDADDDMPLVILAGPVPELGRWAERAVVVLAGAQMAERATTLISRTAPRLIAVAAAEYEVDRVFEALAGQLDGTGVLALEAGLAVEV